jgi:hypothetical protein
MKRLLDSHPQLRADLDQARKGTMGLFSDEQYECALRIAAERFPGLELLVLRPWQLRATRQTLLHFVWSEESLMSRCIFTAQEIPRAPKRLVYGDSESWIVSIKRVRGGRLHARTEIRGRPQLRIVGGKDVLH